MRVSNNGSNPYSFDTNNTSGGASGSSSSLSFEPGDIADPSRWNSRGTSSRSSGRTDPADGMRELFQALSLLMQMLKTMFKQLSSQSDDSDAADTDSATGRTAARAAVHRRTSRRRSVAVTRPAQHRVAALVRSRTRRRVRPLPPLAGFPIRRLPTTRQSGNGATRLRRPRRPPDSMPT
ncbi:hypothetical protein RCH09_001670 [Actimicrobium sp. GrIS 1.19]|nr:hypothetical protein [Actimicrobium sp. GrIS 1.19]